MQFNRLQSLTERKNVQKITLTEEQINRFEQLCECRMARMPVQYIIGNELSNF